MQTKKIGIILHVYRLQKAFQEKHDRAYQFAILKELALKLFKKQLNILELLIMRTNVRFL